ncbi:MAG: NADH-quinone oxidoreductase subunit J [Gemmataceae bacterium]|nr:NADH-quinone oxidoreductase subunit J [Gemmataceae bacterium]
MALFLDLTDPTRGETLLTFVRAHWPIWAIVGLGFVGLYTLLPAPRRSAPIWGGLLTAAAILLAGVWLMPRDGAWPESVLFYAFSLLAVAGGILMLSQKNPVHAALAFALVVLSTCGLFLLLAAPFLMAATIIIYAGAIVVTFLFVIMLAQQAGLTSADARAREPFLASLTGFVLLGTLWIVIDRTYNVAPLLRQLDQVAQAASWGEVEQVWGTAPAKGNDKTLPALEPLRRAFPGGPVDVLEPAWSRKDLPALKRSAQALLDYHQEHGHRRGTIAVPGHDAAKRPELPAENVAGLGRSLFTHHLVAVELAGVLLLVATIGAIVIAAGRRGEGLR